MALNASNGSNLEQLALKGLSKDSRMVYITQRTLLDGNKTDLSNTERVTE